MKLSRSEITYFKINDVLNSNNFLSILAIDRVERMEAISLSNSFHRNRNWHLCESIFSKINWPVNFQFAKYLTVNIYTVMVI